MAVLNDADRAAVAADWTARVLVAGNVTASVCAPDIAAAVAALDDYLEATAAALAALFAEPFHGAVAAPGKATLLALVAAKRAGL